MITVKASMKEKLMNKQIQIEISSGVELFICRYCSAKRERVGNAGESQVRVTAVTINSQRRTSAI